MPEWLHVLLFAIRHVSPLQQVVKRPPLLQNALHQQLAVNSPHPAAGAAHISAESERTQLDSPATRSEASGVPVYALNYCRMPCNMNAQPHCTAAGTTVPRCSPSTFYGSVSARPSTSICSHSPSQWPHGTQGTRASTRANTTCVDIERGDQGCLTRGTPHERMESQPMHAQLVAAPSAQHHNTTARPQPQGGNAAYANGRALRERSPGRRTCRSA